MSEITDEKGNIGKEISDALNNKDLPNIYFNGFIQSIGTGDIAIVIKRNNNPVALLNTSYTVAKTFAQKLNDLISRLEFKTSNTIMTTEDISKKLLEEDINKKSLGGNGGKDKSNKRK